MRNIGLIIIGTILIILLLGLAGDTIHIYSYRVALRNHLLEAARAGVDSIEDEGMAKHLIKEKALEKGIELMDQDITVDPEGNQIIVAKKDGVKTYFTWLLGQKRISIYTQVNLKLKDG